MNNAILTKEMRYLETLPEKTLGYYCKLENPPGHIEETNLGSKPVLLKTLEKELVLHCMELEKKE